MAQKDLWVHALGRPRPFAACRIVRGSRTASIGRDMWWSVIKESATSWSSHKDARQGAALVYYSVVSLGPITAIVIAVAGLLFGHDAVTAQVMSFTKAMLGETGAK